jgi:negative regulator of sigma E activity
MSDDQLPDRAEQASAYLDGELDADQRAVVENDAGAVAMVDSFARIRAELSKAEPVDDAVRSAALAAALAEFDVRHETADPAAAAAVVTSLQSRRHRTYRVLMGVAAAIVIAVVGVAALNSSKRNDANSTALVAPDQTAEQPQPKLAAAPATAGANDAAGAAPAGTAAPGRSRSRAPPPRCRSSTARRAQGVRRQFPDRRGRTGPRGDDGSRNRNRRRNAGPRRHLRPVACVTPGQTELGRSCTEALRPSSSASTRVEPSWRSPCGLRRARHRAVTRGPSGRASAGSRLESCLVIH